MISRQNTGFVYAIPIVCIFLLVLTLSSPAILRENTLHAIKNGGVIITFDDDSISDWYNVEHVLNKYNWKATFFVSHFNSLDDEDIERLRDLQSQGHEIASHSEHHLNAIKFISTHSLKEYIKSDILPSINKMKEKEFNVSAFSYPYGVRNKMTDRALLKHFKMLRGSTFSKKGPSRNNNFANGSSVAFGLGIDQKYGLDDNYILSILRYSKKHNKIAIFYAHRVDTEDHPSGYVTSYKTLETICKYVEANHMHFMTMKDLVIEKN
jgi:peptidoglycan/xylan/chitin deacetylase (PgdA/CDA1 family)